MRTGSRAYQPRINAVFLQDSWNKRFALLSPGVHDLGLFAQAGQYLNLGLLGCVCRGPADQGHARRNDELGSQVPHDAEDVSAALIL